jgi:hypothetical protein
MNHTKQKRVVFFYLFAFVSDILCQKINKEAHMLFATYQPYCWKETSPAPDYCSRHIGKDIVDCFAADTIEDFIIGTMITSPTWPEQLILFEAKHFHFIDKLGHYLAIDGLGGRPLYSNNPILNSLDTVKWISEKYETDTPYQDFCDMYNSTFPKYKYEFLYPKNRIKPIKIIDIKTMVEKLFDEEYDGDWRTLKKEFVDDNFEYWSCGYLDAEKMTVVKPKLEAQWVFQQFITCYDLVNVANEIYGKNISMEFDVDNYWKLFKRVDNEKTEQRLDKLVKYIKSSIKYKN